MKNQISIPFQGLKIPAEGIALIVLMCLLYSAGWWARWADQTAALLDPGIWQLLLLSVFCFMGLAHLSWWLLHRTWQGLGFPPIKILVSQFKELSLWQQYILFWASFAWLLLCSLLSLVAIF